MKFGSKFIYLIGWLAIRIEYYLLCKLKNKQPVLFKFDNVNMNFEYEIK